MGIVGALDVHRSQSTFEYADSVTGELVRGQIVGTRAGLAEFLDRFEAGSDVEFAFEGCTGWRYVAEELAGRGFGPHMAEPAETAMMRGRKRRAKTDRTDAALLRELLVSGDLPESWIPPSFVTDMRVLARSYQALQADRRRWIQRVHAQVFQHGFAPVPLRGRDRRNEALAALDVSEPVRMMLVNAQTMLDGCEDQLAVTAASLRGFATAHPGPRSLLPLYGIGQLLAPIIWAEMGDTRRFSSSRQAVRFAGLDVTVHDSNSRRRPGYLSKQGSPTLRWALVEAGQCAARKSSPDHDYYLQTKERLGGGRAALSVARKLARRVHHILAEQGDDAWQPI
jgi:transposase